MRAPDRMPGAPPLRRVPHTATTSPLVGHPGVCDSCAPSPRPSADPRTVGPQARALPDAREDRRTRRIQPVDEQGSRDPVAGVPTELPPAAAGGGEASQVPQPAQQDARARAAVRLPGGGLRPSVLSVGRAHTTHPYPHRSKAVPVSYLHAVVQSLGPSHDTCPDSHRREAVRVRRVRPKVRALRREEASCEGSPEAAAQEGASRARTAARPALARALAAAESRALTFRHFAR